MDVPQTGYAEAKQRSHCQSDHQALYQAGEPDTNKIDDGADPDQSERARDRRQARQRVEVSPKPKGHIATDEDISSPIPPAHQEAPMRTKQGAAERVSSSAPPLAPRDSSTLQRPH